MNGKWHGGKGDQRRKNANDDAYRKGWDRIFNNGDKVKNDRDKSKV